jgi:transketolase
MNLEELCINTIRMLSVDMVQKANSGHPGMPMGAAPMAYVLWTRHLKFNPKNPEWPDRDRFVLSAGHGSALLYSLLFLTGYDLPMEELKRFRQWGSTTPGHIEHGKPPGVECTTGPLGQGFANSVGMAMAEKHLAALFNRPGLDIVNHYTYSIVSDGDLMEGISSEAASLAGHFKLGKIIYLYDNNHISLSGETRLTFTEDMRKRFEGFGWHYQSVEDGNDTGAIDRAIQNAREETERPSLISVRTHIGYGSPNKQDTYEVHGSPLGLEEVKLTKKNLNWPLDPDFYVPDDALEFYRKAIENGRNAEQNWLALFERWAENYPDLKTQWDSVMKLECLPGWEESIPEFPQEEKGIATRVAGGKVMNAFADKVPALMGGSGDLNPSTFTALAGRGTFEPPLPGGEKVQGSVGKWDYAGPNVTYGVREHAMCAITNGLALHGGILPYASTFLIFSDYARPAIRLACMMNIRVIYVFTHDSIGLGEDGPTHQPIEHLASLRAMPNMTVIRPADANETAEAWRLILKHKGGPVSLILTRQKLPVIDRKKYAGASGLHRGAYILAGEPGERPDIILIATGSEVQLALGAYERLSEDGIRASVVSMPSEKIFLAQPKEYRNQVLPPNVSERLSVEAAATFGWERFTGPHGEIIGIDRFGASAPGKTIMENFGFSIDNVTAKAKSLLEKKARVF